jgi:Asp-tRNA(Asn)/Glu-tRNA(Gln) amidotransferase A subunit family amidase
VVKRQQDRDVATLFPTIQTLTERQYQLFFLLQSVIARHQPEGFARLLDDDVAEAAGTLASTLETASRGVIYEHPAQSPPAQQLVTAIKAFLAEIRQQGATVYDGEIPPVLRAIERGARETRKTTAGDDAYLALMARLLNQRRESPQRAAEQSLIVP